MTIDLTNVENLSGQDSMVIERFLRGIQMLRQDFNGKVLTIRGDDLRTLAMLLDQTEESFSDHLTISESPPKGPRSPRYGSCLRRHWRYRLFSESAIPDILAIVLASHDASPIPLSDE